MDVKEKQLQGKRGRVKLGGKLEGKEGGRRGNRKDQETFNGLGAIVDHSTASLSGSLVEVR